MGSARATAHVLSCTVASCEKIKDEPLVRTYIYIYTLIVSGTDSLSIQHEWVHMRNIARATVYVLSCTVASCEKIKDESMVRTCINILIVSGTDSLSIQHEWVPMRNTARATTHVLSCTLAGCEKIEG